jgi:hypothetical protein
MDYGITGGIAGLVLSIQLMRFLARRFPAEVSPSERTIPFDELRREYWKWELAAVGVFVASTCVIGLLVFWLLRTYADSRAIALAPSPYALLPADIVWLLPSMLIGALCAALPATLFLRFALSDRYARYLTYSKRRFGFDVKRWELPFYALLGVVCAAFVGLGLDFYVVFGENAVTLNDFWSLGVRTYPYSEVRQIRVSDKMEAPNGNVVDRWTVVVEFADGHRWSSRWDPSGSGESRLREIAAFIERRSDRKLDVLPILLRRDQ